MLPGADLCPQQSQQAQRKHECRDQDFDQAQPGLPAVHCNASPGHSPHPRHQARAPDNVHHQTPGGQLRLCARANHEGPVAAGGAVRHEGNQIVRESGAAAIAELQLRVHRRPGLHQAAGIDLRLPTGIAEHDPAATVVTVAAQCAGHRVAGGAQAHGEIAAHRLAAGQIQRRQQPGRLGPHLRPLLQALKSGYRHRREYAQQGEHQHQLHQSQAPGWFAFEHPVHETPPCCLSAYPGDGALPANGGI